MNTRSFVLVGAMGVVLALTACLAPRSGAARPGAVEDPSQHWVQDARLRQIMTELDRLTLTTWPQEIAAERKEAVSRQAQDALDEACALADGLADTASMIPETVSHLKMNEADRSAFSALVETLRGQALRLEETGRRGELDAMRATLQAISDTCNSCHARFADFAGPMTES